MKTLIQQQRPALRDEVEEAAKILHEYWPLDAFVAVNPLFGMVDSSFEEAIGTAQANMSANGYLSEDRYREMFAAGQISLDDIRAAASNQLWKLEPRPTDLKTAVDVVTADLLCAPPARAAAPPVRTRAEISDELHGTQIASAADRQAAKWCAAFFDAGETTWSMPGRESGLYAAWRDLAKLDRTAKRLGAGDLRPAAKRLPADPEEALAILLASLEVEDAVRIGYLRRVLGRQPGWASMTMHRANSDGDADLVQYLAIVLFYESELVKAAAARNGSSIAALQHSSSQLVDAALGELNDRVDRVLGRLEAAGQSLDRDTVSEVLAAVAPRERSAIWLAAHESGYRDNLLAWTDGASRIGPERPATQSVFCIDARSASLRSKLESLGDHETIGFAGFFALPLSWQSLSAESSSSYCPVLIAPTNYVQEELLPGTERSGERALSARSRAAASAEVLHSVNDDTSSKYALAEAAGWVAGPVAAIRTIGVGLWSQLLEGRERRLSAQLKSRPQIEASSAPHGRTDSFTLGFTPNQRLDWAESALRSMGLTSRFARIVMFCGHGSTTQNNPFATSLNCGACGGRHGGPNARVAAALLNDDCVRGGLADRGITIPDDTSFVAAEHDTTRDVVTVFDRESVPEYNRPQLEQLEVDLERACESRAVRRLIELGVDPSATRKPLNAARLRGFDWAQVRPEWGLARNAAFIVGPRGMTQGIDLQDRAFLHSYHPASDRDGSVLEMILTAPMVVAHWINMQYYCSTVDPQVFGAGSKVVHNVVGRTGVLQGPDGDLKLGLPTQATHRDGAPYHEPLRLLTIVESPLERIDAVIERNEVLQQLFNGGWVQLAARGSAADAWQLRTRDGEWRMWLPAGLESLTPCIKTTENGHNGQEVAQ